jgi:hypothetical protein
MLLGESTPLNKGNRQKNPILPGLIECVIYEYRYTTKGLE